MAPTGVRVLQLRHRYSFSGSLPTDSVGGPTWDGSLHNGASVTGGSLVLGDYGAGYPVTGYLSLPSGILDSYTDVTIELWFSSLWNWDNARLLQVGIGGGSDRGSLYIIRPSGGNLYVWFTRPDGETMQSEWLGRFNEQTNMHMVITISASGIQRVYVNSALMSSMDLGPYPLAQINSNTFYIGKSFSTIPTPGFLGSVHELRIWEGTLSPSEVVASYAAGPGACDDQFIACDNYFCIVSCLMKYIH